MNALLDAALILALALNFFALGVSRIRAVINAVALQGVLLGACSLLVHGHPTVRGLLLALAVIVLKGIVIPGFLVHAMREADIQHEVTPFVSFMNSLLLGALGTGVAVGFAHTLPLAESHAQAMLVPASFATVWTGFLLLMTRKKAIMQVLGYLLVENGIFIFGLLLLDAMPFLVEIGVLLDLFTGIFVMAIIIHHISREFSSIGTEHLTELKE
jgi:hydrogenase-4 component E